MKRSLLDKLLIAPQVKKKICVFYGIAAVLIIPRRL
jgi:hypothetical protein